ncbi:MAG: putative quinol monooxygenase [Acidimicrobiales bacterium]
MATLLAHITVRPGTEARFEAIARELYAASHGSEPGLRYYEYWRGQAERSYYTLLAFDDHRAWIDHQVSDHHESSSPDLRPIIESIRLEFVDPVVGASPLPPTERQEPRADADELTVAYTERFAATVADWWQVRRDDP